MNDLQHDVKTGVVGHSCSFTISFHVATDIMKLWNDCQYLFIGDSHIYEDYLLLNSDEYEFYGKFV